MILNLYNLMFFLKKHTQSQFKLLSDMCTVDYPWKLNRFEVFYNILSIVFNCRLTISVNSNEQKALYSIRSLFSVSGWFERESWDLFGIYFQNNTDLRRILTDYGFKGHALRKDFPQLGFVETRYFQIEHRMLFEEISLEQDARIFNFF